MTADRDEFGRMWDNEVEAVRERANERERRAAREADARRDKGAGDEAVGTDAVEGERDRRGRFRKGVCANPWGRGGSPDKKARRRAACNVPIRTILHEELCREIEVTEGGRTVTLPLRRVLVRKVLQDMMVGPPRVRLNLLLGHRSKFIDLLESAAAEFEDETGGWTEELEERYQYVAEHYELVDVFEQERRYRDFMAWCETQRRNDQPAFDAMTQEQQMQRFCREQFDEEQAAPVQCAPRERGREGRRADEPDAGDVDLDRIDWDGCYIEPLR